MFPDTHQSALFVPCVVISWSLRGGGGHIPEQDCSLLMKIEFNFKKVFLGPLICKYMLYIYAAYIVGKNHEKGFNWITNTWTKTHMA